jgi:hypothetical protein
MVRSTRMHEKACGDPALSRRQDDPATFFLCSPIFNHHAAGAHADIFPMESKAWEGAAVCKKTVIRSANGEYSNLQFDFYLREPILRGNNTQHTKRFTMSTTLQLPSSSLTAAKGQTNLFQQAVRAVAALFSASAADTSDVWRLYRLAGNSDSVSPSAVKALAKAARAN